jgi:hypothetical protein
MSRPECAVMVVGGPTAVLHLGGLVPGKFGTAR